MHATPPSSPFGGRTSASSALALGAVLMLTSCHDAVTSPSAMRAAPERAAVTALDSPASGSAELVVGSEAPLAGNQQLLGHYPTATVIAMTVHQHFALTGVPPYAPIHGEIGLAGRSSGFGCSHQGEAYLLSYPDEGGYSFPFSGCTLAANPTLATTFTDTVAVTGWLYYGYGYDAACPYPDVGCAAYSGSSGASVSRLSATLAIAGDSVRGGALRAWPFREYTLTAAPTPERMGRYLTPVLPMGTGWTFRPDSGGVESDVCENGSARTCITRFRRSGSLTLEAMVNGEQMTSAPLRIQAPELQLVLSADSVAAGDTVLATTTVLGLDTTFLSYYFVSTTPPPTNGATALVPPPAAAPSTGATGLPPCLATKPVPTRCYLVFTQPGRATVEVGAFLDLRRGLSVWSRKQLTVTGANARVKLSLARQKIEPTARYWKFNPKTKQYLLHPDRMPDTSRTVLTVSVVDGSGVATPNAEVVLHLAAVEPRAGHDHLGGKPVGLLETLQKAPITDGRINTGSSGVARLYVTAPEISGPVLIEGTSPGAKPDTTSLEVMIGGLVPMTPGPSYLFTGAIAGKHTDNHYGTPAALSAFRVFADSLHRWTGEPLGINDISLAQGGLFDVGGHTWELPHGYHRRGTHADIRTRYANRVTFPKDLQLRMRDLWHRILGYGTAVDEADHLHLNYSR